MGRDQKDHGRTKSLLALRSDFFQIVAVAIVVSIGTNILSSSITNFAQNDWINLSAGIVLVACGLVFAFWKAKVKLNGVTEYEGIIFLDPNTRESIEVERYEFSEKITSYLKGLCLENKALGKLWAENEFYKFPEKLNSKVNIEKTPSTKLAVELIEYFILSKLSTHLTDYFNKNEDSEEDKLITMYRNDVPEIFTMNRFIDLFSRPMEERDAFGSHPARKPSHGEVVAAFGPGGVLFDRFDLTLPRETKISRDGHGTVVLKTNRFKMKMVSKIEFSSAHVPFEFFEYYMGRKFDEIETNYCSITVDINFNKIGLLSAKGWQYYRWVDSFLDELHEDISFDGFLRKIDWESVLTFEIMKKTSARKRVKNIVKQEG